MSSLLLEAVEKIALIARKSNVHGTPQLTITFDSNRDRALFEAEVNREMNGPDGVAFRTMGFSDWYEALIYGVRVRIL